MKIYKVKFIGRHIGAIGMFVRFSTVMKGESEEDVKRKLYEEYEHIQELEIKEITRV